MTTPKNSRNSSRKRLASRSATKCVFRSFVAVLTLIAYLVAATTATAAEPVRTAPTVTTTLPQSPPLMIPLQKGWVAPFGGVLLNPPAVAQIAVDAKNAKKECDIRVDSEVAKEKAFGDTRLKDKDAELKYAKDTLGEQLKLRDAELTRLRKETTSAAGSQTWWGVGGFAGGLLVTLTIVFLVSVSSK